MKFIKKIIKYISSLSSATKFGVVIVVLMTTTSVVTIAYNTIFEIDDSKDRKQKIPLLYEMKENLIFEYGEPIVLKPETFVTAKDSTVYEEIKVHVDLDMEENKKYPSVGEYTGEIIYKDKKQKFAFKIVDSTPPTFQAFCESVELFIDNKNTEEGLKTYFLAEDISGNPILSFAGEYDFGKAGSYELKVIAEDKYGNQVSRSFVLVIKNIIEENESNPQISKDAGGKTAASDINKDQEINRPNREDAPSNNEPNQTGSTSVCKPGDPNPEMIGNSGLLFYGDEAYFEWEMQFLQSEEYYAIEGFSSWPIATDCMGNDILSQRIWTVEWW